MTPTHLQQWIQHPETLNRDTLYELRTLVARYPYFQSLRLLYLKNLYLLHDINFGAELRKAVLYVADRRVLFYFIEGDRYTLKSRKVSSLFSGDLEKEPSVDRTLSLIDAFLATVPEEHSQHTELDYAVDYTAYLMQEEPGVDAEDESEVPKLRGHELIDDFIQKSESSDASDTRREFLVEKEEETEEEVEISHHFIDITDRVTEKEEGEHVIAIPVFTDGFEMDKCYEGHHENMLYKFNELVSLMDELGASGIIINCLGISYFMRTALMKKILK